MPGDLRPCKRRRELFYSDNPVAVVDEDHKAQSQTRRESAKRDAGRAVLRLVRGGAVGLAGKRGMGLFELRSANGLAARHAGRGRGFVADGRVVLPEYGPELSQMGLGTPRPLAQLVAG